MVVVLDSGPLGLATHPNPGVEAMACQEWISELIAARIRIMVPEIADYEVRRELIRSRRHRGLQLLDGAMVWAEYLGITTDIMRRAAHFWADVRSQGLQTADDRRLDADVILAAQVDSLELPEAVVATTNVGHIARFCNAELWMDIHAT